MDFPEVLKKYPKPPEWKPISVEGMIEYLAAVRGIKIDDCPLLRQNLNSYYGA